MQSADSLSAKSGAASAPSSSSPPPPSLLSRCHVPLSIQASGWALHHVLVPCATAADVRDKLPSPPSSSALSSSLSGTYWQIVDASQSAQQRIGCCTEPSDPQWLLLEPVAESSSSASPAAIGVAATATPFTRKGATVQRLGAIWARMVVSQHLVSSCVPFGGSDGDDAAEGKQYDGTLNDSNDGERKKCWLTEYAKEAASSLFSVAGKGTSSLSTIAFLEGKAFSSSSSSFSTGCFVTVRCTRGCSGGGAVDVGYLTSFAIECRSSEVEEGADAAAVALIVTIAGFCKPPLQSTSVAAGKDGGANNNKNPLFREDQLSSWATIIGDAQRQLFASEGVGIGAESGVNDGTMFLSLDVRSAGTSLIIPYTSSSSLSGRLPTITSFHNGGGGGVCVSSPTFWKEDASGGKGADGDATNGANNKADANAAGVVSISVSPRSFGVAKKGGTLPTNIYACDAMKKLLSTLSSSASTSTSDTNAAVISNFDRHMEAIFTKLRKAFNLVHHNTETTDATSGADEKESPLSHLSADERKKRINALMEGAMREIGGGEEEEEERDGAVVIADGRVGFARKASVFLGTTTTASSLSSGWLVPPRLRQANGVEVRVSAPDADGVGAGADIDASPSSTTSSTSNAQLLPYQAVPLLPTLISPLTYDALCASDAIAAGDGAVRTSKPPLPSSAALVAPLLAHGFDATLLSEWARVSVGRDDHHHGAEKEGSAASAAVLETLWLPRRSRQSATDGSKSKRRHPPLPTRQTHVPFVLPPTNVMIQRRQQQQQPSLRCSPLSLSHIVTVKSTSEEDTIVFMFNRVLSVASSASLRGEGEHAHHDDDGGLRLTYSRVHDARSIDQLMAVLVGRNAAVPMPKQKKRGGAAADESSFSSDVDDEEVQKRRAKAAEKNALVAFDALKMKCENNACEIAECILPPTQTPVLKPSSSPSVAALQAVIEGGGRGAQGGGGGPSSALLNTFGFLRLRQYSSATSSSSSDGGADNATIDVTITDKCFWIRGSSCGTAGHLECWETTLSSLRTAMGPARAQRLMAGDDDGDEKDDRFAFSASFIEWVRAHTAVW